MTTAHAIAFCAGPLIVALLLAISGAFTQSAKTAARPPHAHVAFTSRFGARLSGNAHSLLLVCLMAALAECWNSVVTPDLGSVLGVDLQGTLLNLSGAALGGFAAVLAAHGGRRGALWSAFNDGFVAAYTSFVFFVVHAAELAARGAGDPSTSVRAGDASRSPVRRRVGSLEPRPGEARQGDRGPVDAVPPRLPPPRPRVPPPRAPRGARRVPAAGGAAARRRRGPRGAARGAPGRGARARVRRGPGPRRRARLRLRGHGARVRRRRARRPPRRLRAVLRRPRPAPRRRARHARASPGAAQVHEGEVNWGTAFANAVALALASSIFVVFRLPAYVAARRGAAGDRLHAALDRVAGSFCGALSGFGAYSEDVAQTLREHDPDGALANVAVNAIVALAFKSLLLPIFDGALGA